MCSVHRPYPPHRKLCSLMILTATASNSAYSSSSATATAVAAAAAITAVAVSAAAAAIPSSTHGVCMKNLSLFGLERSKYLAR